MNRRVYEQDVQEIFISSLQVGYIHDMLHIIILMYSYVHVQMYLLTKKNIDAPYNNQSFQMKRLNKRTSTWIQQSLTI